MEPRLRLRVELAFIHALLTTPEYSQICTLLWLHACLDLVEREARLWQVIKLKSTPSASPHSPFTYGFIHTTRYMNMTHESPQRAQSEKGEAPRPLVGTVSLRVRRAAQVRSRVIDIAVWVAASWRELSSESDLLYQPS